MSADGRARARGFTLIEVMVALIILSILALSALELLSMETATAIRVSERFAAETVVENATVLTKTAPRAPELGTERGSERIDGRSIEWVRETVESGVPGLVRVEIIVRSPEDGRTIASRTLLMQGGEGARP